MSWDDVEEMGEWGRRMLIDIENTEMLGSDEEWEEFVFGTIKYDRHYWASEEQLNVLKEYREELRHQVGFEWDSARERYWDVYTGRFISREDAGMRWSAYKLFH